MTDARYGKIPTTAVRRLKLSSPVRESSGVVEHGSVDRAGEVALEDAASPIDECGHGRGTGRVSGGRGVVAELDHRRPIHGWRLRRRLPPRERRCWMSAS